MAIPEEGGYRAVAQVGEDKRSVSFQVFNEAKPAQFR
jgi:hypothetical protein